MTKLNLTGYRLNEQVLRELEEGGLPVAYHEVLKNDFLWKFFESSESLRNDLKKRMPTDTKPEHIDLIVNKAKRLRFSRILRLIESLCDFYVPQSAILLPLYNHISILPFLLFVRLRLRFILFWFQAKIKGKDLIRSQKNSNESGYVHNFNQVLDFSWGHRNRTERLMNVLKSLDGYDVKNFRLLVVGPRNEAELLLLKAHGFHSVSSIDLFTYSPLIEPMDMNDLKYDADTFDVYYSSAVIKYSPDIKKSVSESLRVTKNGGLMVFMFMYGGHNDLIPEGSALDGGVQELLDLYQPHVEHVHYWNEFKFTEQDYRAAVIFKIKK